MYDVIRLVLLLLVAVAVLASVARRLSIPYPIALLLGGLILTVMPGLPRVQLDPAVIFLLFLPPLVCAAGWTTSLHDVVDNLRSILVLAVVLVLVTTAVVGVIAHLAVPGLSWPAAFILGAIVSPTDTVAAGAVASRVPMPHRIVAVIEGEGLFNDAIGLVAYGSGISAALSGTFSPVAASLTLIKVSVLGVAIGVGIGFLAMQLIRRIEVEGPAIVITLTLLIPFAAYLPAQALGVSGVLATAAAGLYGGQAEARVFSANTRLQAYAVWETLVFLLNGLLFILVGLQLPRVVQGLQGHTAGQLVADVLVVSLSVIVVRLAWVFLTGLGLARLGRGTYRVAVTTWREALILGWTGMRGGVSLAAALAIPLAIGGRDLIILLTFGVILVTLVVQGLSLPALVQRLGLADPGEVVGAEQEARLAAYRAVLAFLDSEEAPDGVPPEQLARLRSIYDRRIQQVSAHAKATQSDAEAAQGDQDPAAAYQQLTRTLLTVQRRAVIALHDQGRLGDESRRRVERTLDLEEAQL
ncbi:MAG TPA: Na+/H+ antiporter [Chloroflexota bacterium]|nr:Na+/H+ antiporter [Chloroflexota bacterium]